MWRHADFVFFSSFSFFIFFSIVFGFSCFFLDTLLFASFLCFILFALTKDDLDKVDMSSWSVTSTCYYYNFIYITLESPASRHAQMLG